MSIRSRRLFTTVAFALGSLAAALPAQAFNLDNHNETVLRDGD